MTKKTALKWESGNIPSHFIAFGERRFKALSEAHGIPVEWLLCWDFLNANYCNRKAEREAEAAKEASQPQAKAAS